MMDRRSFLRAVPAAGVALTVPAVAIAQPKQMTPRQRLDAAIAELKAASAELWPTADDWTIKVGSTPSIPLMITNYDPTWDKRGKLKVHVDDGSPLLADDVTGSTAFRDWERRKSA